MNRHDDGNRHSQQSLIAPAGAGCEPGGAVNTDAPHAECEVFSGEMGSMANDTAGPRIRSGNELVPEEQQRLLTHGLHEENVFYNRLNFFMVCESLLFSAAVTGITGDTPRTTLIVLPICVLGLLVSTLWLYVQLDKLVLLRVLETRAEEALPEFKETILLAERQGLVVLRKRKSVSGLLAWTLPLLFVLAWVGFGGVALLIVGG